jgi:uncharacterized SAM-binding protein YcdF (DUF218 family)
MLPLMRRRRVVLMAVALVVVATLTVLTYRLFVWPSTKPPGHVDAVVVFAGGNGERQHEGVRLVKAGVAPVLVMSDGGEPNRSKYAACKQPQDFTLICFSPQQDNSRSEAREFAELAATNHWRSVALVTSTTHVRRASLLLGRCYDGEVYTVATPLTNDYKHEMFGQVLHEWGGLVEALTVRRGC